MGKGCDGEPRLWWGLCTMQVKAKCPSWDSGQTQGSPKPLDHIFAEFPNHSCQHHGSCGDCGGSSSALPTAKLVDPTGMVMEVNKKRKPRKNSHSLGHVACTQHGGSSLLLGACTHFKPAHTSSGAQTPLLPARPPWQGWTPTLAPQHEHHLKSHALRRWGWCGQMVSGWRRKSDVALQK